MRVSFFIFTSKQPFFFVLYAPAAPSTILLDHTGELILMSQLLTMFVANRSSNAQYLALSSRDGYCTLVEFETNELGSPISSAGLMLFLFYCFC